jgi:hypothetical protein
MAYPSTLKMEAGRSSENPINSYQKIVLSKCISIWKMVSTSEDCTAVYSCIDFIAQEA